jgi:hypothetical protein
MDLLRFPSFRCRPIWRLVHWHGRLSLDTQRKKNHNQLQILGELAAIYFWNTLTPRLLRERHIGRCHFWGKGLCIHLLALLDVPKHTQKRIESNPFFLSFRISGHPYHVQSIEHFTGIKYRRQAKSVPDNRFWLVVKRTCVPGGPHTRQSSQFHKSHLAAWPTDQLGPILKWQIMWQKVHSSRTPSTYIAKKSNLSIRTPTPTSAQVLHSPNKGNR